MTYYRQCRVERDGRFFTTWLPEQFAVVRKVLSFEKEGHGWTVAWVSATRLTENEVLAHERDWKLAGTETIDSKR